MMLPVLSTESLCKTLLSFEYIDSGIMSRMTANLLVSYLRPSAVYSDDSRVLHVMVYK